MNRSPVIVFMAVALITFTYGGGGEEESLVQSFQAHLNQYIIDRKTAPNSSHIFECPISESYYFVITADEKSQKATLELVEYNKVRELENGIDGLLWHVEKGMEGSDSGPMEAAINDLFKYIENMNTTKFLQPYVVTKYIFTFSKRTKSGCKVANCIGAGFLVWKKKPEHALDRVQSTPTSGTTAILYGRERLTARRDAHCR